MHLPADSIARAARRHDGGAAQSGGGRSPASSGSSTTSTCSIASFGSSSGSGTSSSSSPRPDSPDRGPGRRSVPAESLGQLSLATWNMNAPLAGYGLGGPSVALFRRRSLRIRKLIESHSLLLLQEARATDIKVQLLRSNFPSASLYGTCGSGVGAGGIVTMTSRDFADQYPFREFVMVVPGRISTLRCMSRVGGGAWIALWSSWGPSASAPAPEAVGAPPGRGRHDDRRGRQFRGCDGGSIERGLWPPGVR